MVSPIPPATLLSPYMAEGKEEKTCEEHAIHLKLQGSLEMA